MAIARSTPAQKPRGLASRTSMIITLVDGRRSVAAAPEAVEDQQCGADRDRAVGNIESRIVPTLPMEKQEIDHAAERQAIPEIAQRTTEDEREPGAIPGVAAFAQQPDDKGRGGDRDCGEQIPRPIARVA